MSKRESSAATCHTKAGGDGAVSPELCFVVFADARRLRHGTLAGDLATKAATVGKRSANH